MCHAVAAAAPAVHCNGIQPYKGAAWEEGRLFLLSSRGVINYLALCATHIFSDLIVDSYFPDVGTSVNFR